MGSCAAPSAKGDDKFITTDYLQQCLNNNLNEATRQIASFQAQVQVQQDALLVVDRQMSYMRQQVSARMLQRYQNNYHFGGAR